MNRSWSQTDLDFLRQNCGILKWAQIGQVLGKTKSAVACKARVLGLCSPRTWTPQEIQAMRDLYPSYSTEEVAKAIGRSVSSVYNAAFNLDLKKSPEYLEQHRRLGGERLLKSGKAHRFPKGHVPVNKGIRQPGWAPGNMAKTQFKKGQKGHNWKPVGSTRIDTDGYVYVKVREPNKWALQHRIVWERENGPVPVGLNIVFKDGNKLNCDISNLEAITDAELMSRNTFHNYPEPVKSQIHILAGFKRRLNSYAKKQDRGSAKSSV